MNTQCPETQCHNYQAQALGPKKYIQYLPPSPLGTVNLLDAKQLPTSKSSTKFTIFSYVKMILREIRKE